MADTAIAESGKISLAAGKAAYPVLCSCTKAG